MSSCLFLCAGACPQAAGAAAFAEDTWRLWPGQVLWDMAAHSAPEGQQDGCPGWGLWSQSCILRASGVPGTGSGSWHGVDLQSPCWTAAPLLTCCCFLLPSPLRTPRQRKQDLAPSWLMAASPESHPCALCLPLSPWSLQWSVICSMERGTGSTECPGELSARPVSLLPLPA